MSSYADEDLQSAFLAGTFVILLSRATIISTMTFSSHIFSHMHIHTHMRSVHARTRHIGADRVNPLFGPMADAHGIAGAESRRERAVSHPVDRYGHGVSSDQS